jgi:hypothetical protein
MKLIKNKILKAIPIIILLLSIISPIVASNNGPENNTELIIDVKNIDEETLELDIYFPDFEYSSVNIENEKYTTISLGDEGFTTIHGQAKLPAIRRMIEIPYESEPIIQLTNIVWETISLSDLNIPTMVIPVQPSILKIPGALEQAEFIIDTEYYSINNFMPIETSSILETGFIRERNFAFIEINPVTYNPSTGEIQTMNQCTATIEMPNGDLETTYTKISRYSSTSYEELFNNAFINYGIYETGNLRASLDIEGYLIIVHDDFYEEILPLANHKTNIGYETTVTKTSEIPGGISTSTIKSYIEDAYDNWVTPPSYILLVGDTPQIPTFTGSASGTATDTDFVTMDGDIFSDIFIGRFPAANESQVTAMVDKTIYYELGNFPSNDWIKKAVFMASTDNYDISEGTHNYVIENYLEPNNYTSDKLYTVTYSATTQDVRDSLNDGRSIAIYSGHGATTYWADGPEFYQSDVNDLTNEGMYPFVVSHSCITGTFDYGECFGETWLRAPNKGGLAFWGSSHNTYWTEDDTIEKKMFQAWWDDGLERIGQMTEMGLYYAWDFHGGGNMPIFVESYNILGDPSLVIWSDDPGPTEDYDMVVSSLNVPTYNAHGDTIDVEAMVLNFGFINQTNILVNFTVNGSIIDSTVVGSINSTESVLVSFPWNPDNGTYLVGVDVEVISGENDTDNNALDKTVYVVPDPIASVSPPDFDVNLNAGIVFVDSLTVGNNISAEASCDYSVTLSGSWENWLSVDPISGTVLEGDSDVLDVTFNTTGLSEGDYDAVIIVSTNDLHDPVFEIPVSLSVVYAADVGVISVNHPTGLQSSVVTIRLVYLLMSLFMRVVLMVLYILRISQVILLIGR